MQIIDTPLEGLKVLEPKVFRDERGYFFESYNDSKFPYSDQYNWVQDNESMSTRGVLRGLHYQTGKMGQAKLVRSVTGDIYDVAVDIRPDSESFGEWYGVLLTSDNKKQLLIPRGFAHGFLVISEFAIFAYKCDNYYHKESEGGIIFNDPRIAIDWPLDESELLLSKKDKALPTFGKHRTFSTT